MGKIAFVFSGQGAQHVGMGKEFYENIPAVKALYDACEAIRPGTIAQSFEGEGAELKQTENTQPCLYLADLAAAVAMRENGIVPAATAGFSLGEIPALAFCGAYTMEDGFSIACKRGKYMAEAAAMQEASMMAIVKIPYEQAEEMTKKYEHVYPVNYNSPMQLVVSGDKEELSALGKELKAAGGRGVPLAVSGAFHSPYMTPAVAPFREALADYSIRLPEIPVYADVNAAPYAGEPVELLCEQINHPVQWVSLIRRMAEDGFDTFIETGVGNTLQKLIQQILPDAKVYRVEDMETLNSTLAALAE